MRENGRINIVLGQSWEYTVVQLLSHIWLFGLQHARLPCPSLSPRVCSNLHSLSQWCYPTISPSVACFSSCPQFFPESGSFPMSRLFALGGPSIGASVTVLPMNIQGWFPLFDWFDLLAVQGTLKSLLQHHSSKASVLWHSAFFMVQLSNPYITTGKTISLTIWAFVGKVISLGSTENPPLRTAELGCIARFRTLDSQHSMNHWLKKGLPSIHQSQSSTFTGKKKGPEKGSFLPKFTQLAKQDLSPGCSSNSHWHILCPDSTCLSLWEKLKQR